MSKKRKKGAKLPTREEVERVSPTPMPEQLLADAQARLVRLKISGSYQVKLDKDGNPVYRPTGKPVPDRVLARYERAVAELKVWIAAGAPKVDQMSEAVLTYFLAHPERGQSLPWPLPDREQGDVQLMEWPNEQLVAACRALVDR